MIAAGFKLPEKNILLCIGPLAQKAEFLECAKLFVHMGYQLYATKNTHQFLLTQGQLESTTMVFNPRTRREPNALTLLQGSKIDLVVNVPDSMDSQALTDGFDIRRAAVDSNTPLITDIKTAILTCMSLHRKWTRERDGKPFFTYLSWQEYTGSSEAIARLG